MMLDVTASSGQSLISMGTKPISDQVREAVRRSGLTRYSIAQATGIDQAVLSRFMTGKAGLRLETLDKLGLLLGLEVKARRAPRKSQ